ncbi:NifU family protein [Desulfobulbus propionicus]
MEQLQENVKKVPAHIRPAPQRVGGDVELIGLGPHQGLKVRLTGACQGRPMSRIEWKDGIKRFVQHGRATIRAVEAVE